MPCWRGIEQALPEITTTGDNNLAGFFFFPESASSRGFLHGGGKATQKIEKKEGSRDFLPFGLRSGL
jgi:hypothetical protein